MVADAMRVPVGSSSTCRTPGLERAQTVHAPARPAPCNAAIPSRRCRSHLHGRPCPAWISCAPRAAPTRRTGRPERIADRTAKSFAAHLDIAPRAQPSLADLASETLGHNARRRYSALSSALTAVANGAHPGAGERLLTPRGTRGIAPGAKRRTSRSDGWAQECVPSPAPTRRQ